MNNVLKHAATSLFVTAAVVTCATVASVEAARAATLNFTLDDRQGSDSAITDVILMDIVGGVSMTFTVNDPTNTGDIVAVYFDLGATAPATPYSISGAAGVVTSVGYNTRNIAEGNIGQTFDVGVAIGTAGAGKDFFNAVSFDVEAAGLDVSDFLGQTFAARLGTVGSGLNGEGSAKMFGTVPSVLPPEGPPPAVPLPAAGILLLAGLGGLAALRKARKSA